MAEINDRALAIAIQALDATIHALEKEIDAANDLDKPDLEELLVSYISAAGDLQKSYEEAFKPGSNLSPYAELVRD